MPFLCRWSSWKTCAICKLLAGPCSCIHPETNSSRSIQPDSSWSMIKKRVITSWVEIPKDSMKCTSFLAVSACLSSSRDTRFELSWSISEKVIFKASTKDLCLCICFMIAISLSDWALSMAVVQNTPVTTFKTAKTATTMNRIIIMTAAGETSRRGSIACCQSIPPEMDRKSVSILSSTLGQNCKSAGSMQNGRALGSPVAFTC
mmetsp:Transcript_48058/g.112500  ORF Transcript_48058/g.112500 Transcript_48058/m.112500 type:complete len:204 (+) Transcript_48058:216-827(+)